MAHYAHLDMASKSSVAELVQFESDVISIKIYAISVTALWSYNYLLTLDDEVEYAWKTKNMPILVLFMITRYLPVPFLIWIITSSWSPSYTAELCQRTAFLEVVYFTLITLFAHIVLTLRVYAITGKNKQIAGGLYGITILQLGVGVYLCVYSFLHPLQLPHIKLDAFQICLFKTPIRGSLLYTSLSLVFDLAAFLIVFLRTRTLRMQRHNSIVPNIVDTVTRDAAIYFTVIFSSHFVLVLTLTLMRPSLRFLPTV
ncbi:hypothetical protein BJ322DRAFT_1076974 [Thelephora terrestris]|uniref:DUF6533 domain-containing protein n=1 Tax=Thelephora terrestris TaxID=56493 RepID=A0A9P6H8I3_9AGAM|nr:hypothetical protein BJ322DRAFT_1076974 [Thelephora terrestris]